MFQGWAGARTAGTRAAADDGRAARGSASRTSGATSIERLRWRAIADLVLIAGGVVALVGWLPPGHDTLLGILAGTGAGLVIFVGRRGRDLRLLALAERGRRAAAERPGLSLADWHAGAPLAPWDERTSERLGQAPAKPAPPAPDWGSRGAK